MGGFLEIPAARCSATVAAWTPPSGEAPMSLARSGEGQNQWQLIATASKLAAPMVLCGVLPLARRVPE